MPMLDVESAGEEPRGRLYGSNRSYPPYPPYRSSRPIEMPAFRLPGRTDADPPVDSRYCMSDGELVMDSDMALGEVASCSSVYMHDVRKAPAGPQGGRTLQIR